MHSNLAIPLLFALLLSATCLQAQERKFNVNNLDGNSITLKHDQNDFSLEYLGIHFGNPSQNLYMYKMDGIHDDWVQAGKVRVAKFNKLKPGNYTFHVKSANSHGIWAKDPVSMQIKILAPWYWNWWSRILYLAILIAGLYSLYLFQIKHRLQLAESHRLKELDEVKTRLFSNITHEFRTPLAVIQGMAGQIKGNNKAKASIQRNSINLLNLVNQMLDLSKLEAGNMKINMVQGDVVNYLSYLMESFQSFALSKKVRLHFLPQIKSYQMDYDPDKLMKIVANLISNAIKFTDERGDVYVMVSTSELVKDKPEWKKNNFILLKEPNETFIIQVRDTGIGIPEPELDQIFERFYQSDTSTTRKGEGTGIGLAFSQELVRLLNGRIEVESEVGVGSVFTVLLPVTRELPIEFKDAQKDLQRTLVKDNSAEERLDSNIENISSSLPLALIIEDNYDVKEFLASCLQDKYQMIFAENGLQGVELATDLVPDIILSDVMMPEKDGFELCDELKRDFRTSHIPIVLLTAKADVESRITGLKMGADAYIIKPFNQEELYVQLEQLINLRKRLRLRYKNGIGSIKIESKEGPFEREDSFILKIQEAIISDIDSESLDSEHLCKKMGMSASQLYRKLKALTGRSTALYIRYIKLVYARDLLIQTDKSISEIAYEAGFKNPAYFSRSFSEEFGKSPKNARKLESD